MHEQRGRVRQNQTLGCLTREKIRLQNSAVTVDRSWEKARQLSPSQLQRSSTAGFNSKSWRSPLESRRAVTAGVGTRSTVW